MQKVFTVMSRALEDLGRRGVRDVHQRLCARVLPPERPGAEDRAREIAEEAIAELHGRGLEAIAAGLAAELGIDALPSRRLAGSTPAFHPSVPPPSDPSAPAPAAAAGAPDAGSGAPSSPEGGQALEVGFGEGLGVGDEAGAAPVLAGPGSGELVVDPPPHPDGSPRGTITDERAAGMLAPEGGAPVIDELHQPDGGEGLREALEASATERPAPTAVVGVDLASGPDATVAAPAPAPTDGAPWTPEDDAAFRELEVAEAAEKAGAPAEAEAPPAPEAPADGAPAPDAPPAS